MKRGYLLNKEGYWLAIYFPCLFAGLYSLFFYPFIQAFIFSFNELVISREGFV